MKVKDEADDTGKKPAGDDIVRIFYIMRHTQGAQNFYVLEESAGPCRNECDNRLFSLNES
jgi:hypothetical protein